MKMDQWTGEEVLRLGGTFAPLAKSPALCVRRIECHLLTTCSAVTRQEEGPAWPGMRQHGQVAPSTHRPAGEAGRHLTQCPSCAAVVDGGSPNPTGANLPTGGVEIVLGNGVGSSVRVRFYRVVRHVPGVLLFFRDPTSGPDDGRPSPAHPTCAWRPRMNEAGNPSECEKLPALGEDEAISTCFSGETENRMREGVGCFAYPLLRLASCLTYPPRQVARHHGCIS
jgi:hypothetical protein